MDVRGLCEWARAVDQEWVQYRNTRFEMKGRITAATWVDRLKDKGILTKSTLTISQLRSGDVWQGIARYDTWMAKTARRSHIDLLLEHFTFLEGIVRQLASEDENVGTTIFN